MDNENDAMGAKPRALVAMSLILLPGIANALVGGYTQYTTYGNAPGTFSYPVQGGTEANNPYAPNTSLASSYDQSAQAGQATQAGQGANTTQTSTNTTVTTTSNPSSSQAASGGGGSGSIGAAAVSSGGGSGSGAPSIAADSSAADKILHPNGGAASATAQSSAANSGPPEPMTNQDTRHNMVIKSMERAQANLIRSAGGSVSSSNCLCPYNLNSDGFECGIESAYYRPGGYRLRCYPQDFRGQEYIYYRKNMN